MDHTAAYIGFIYVLVFCLLGGVVAQAKGDYFSRGFCISLMAGVFGPIFFWFAPNSKAKKGDDYDEHNWHANGVFPVMAHVVVILVIYGIYKAVS